MFFSQDNLSNFIYKIHLFHHLQFGKLEQKFLLARLREEDNGGAIVGLAVHAEDLSLPELLVNDGYTRTDVANRRWLDT